MIAPGMMLARPRMRPPTVPPVKPPARLLALARSWGFRVSGCQA